MDVWLSSIQLMVKERFQQLANLAKLIRLLISKELFLKRPINVSPETRRVTRHTSEVINFVYFGDKDFVIITRLVHCASRKRDPLAVCCNLPLVLPPSSPFPVYED